MTLAWVMIVLIVTVVNSCTASTHFKPPLTTYHTTLNLSYTLTEDGCQVNGENFKQNQIFTLTDSADTKCVLFKCMKDRVTTSSMGCDDGENCRTGLFEMDCNTYTCFVGSSVNHQDLTLTVIRTLDNLTPRRCLVHATADCLDLHEWFYLKDRRCRCSLYNLDECEDLPVKIALPAFIVNKQ